MAIAAPPPKSKRDWLAETLTEVKARPSSIIIYGPPGIGKTSLAAAAPKPVFLIDSNEQGIHTLKASKLVAMDIPVLPAATTWADVQGQLDTLISEDHDFRYLCIDTIGGMETLLFDHIVQTEFDGIRGEKGATGFGRGFEACQPHWRQFLNRLDRCRDRGMGVILLAHTSVKTFKNPEGEDYDRWATDLNAKIWGITHRWADMILFANYHVTVEKANRSGKAKGAGGQMRFLNCEWRAGYDAKNRHNLPPEISMGDSGAEAWANLTAEIANARKEF